MRALVGGVDTLGTASTALIAVMALLRESVVRGTHPFGSDARALRRTQSLQVATVILLYDGNRSMLG